MVKGAYRDKAHSEETPDVKKTIREIDSKLIAEFLPN